MNTPHAIPQRSSAAPLATGSTPLLDVQDLSVAFAGRTVVHDISFSVNGGEKMALVGESGSGKTVTALSLLRLLPAAKVSGQVWFEGSGGRQNLAALPERALRGVRGGDIAMIFQEPMTALNPLMPVGVQVAEVLQLKRAATRKEAATAAVELLARTGLDRPAQRARAYPHQLSGGQRQRAMIAMALACNPKLLLADEPTTALDASLRLQILDLLAQLQQETGMAILMITHDLNLVRRFADRLAVMQRGRLVEQGAVDAIFNHPAHAYTRHLLGSKPRRDALPAPSANAAPVLQVDNLQVAYPTPLPGVRGWFGKGRFVALQQASLEIRPGQTLGLIGESGSGKSTLAQAVLALLPPRQVHGDIQIQGQRWQFRTRADRPLRRVVQVVFQDPFSSLSPRQTIGQIVAEGLQVHWPELTAAKRRERVVAALADVGLPEAASAGFLARYPHQFSGGQRQRIALARALVVAPELLVLDEPTSALDVTVQQQVLTLLKKLQAEHGLSYLLITHDVDVVWALAHEVMVLKEGAVVERGAADQVLRRPRHAYTQALLAAAGLAP